MRWTIFVGLLALPVSAAGQLPEWPALGYVPNEALAGPASACLTELDLTGFDGAAERGCSVLAVDTLGWPDVHIVVVRIQRVLTEPAIAWRDSTLVDELLVARPHGEGSIIPVWRRFGYHNVLGPLEASEWSSTPMLRIPNCVRGTGGCVEDLLIAVGGAWRQMELAFVAELAEHLPSGYRLHKGRRIDLDTLEFVQPIAARGDPNCCPSRELVGRLRVVGERVVLAGAPLERAAGYE